MTARSKALAENPPYDIVGRGAERHADANLLGPLRRGIRDDTVDADAREKQGDGRKKCSEQRIETGLAVQGRDSRLHAAEVGNGLAVPTGIAKSGTQLRREVVWTVAVVRSIT